MISRFLLILIALTMTTPAYAAEPLPGDACSAANNLQFTSGPEVSGGGGHAMLCQGGTWKSILSFNSTAALTKVGNLACTNGQILKFNGTTWGCAADSGGTLPTLTSANIWVGNGSNAATAVAMSGDATLSNAGALSLAANAVANAEMADDAIGIAELSATGTASATTYLRGDNTWATVPSGADNLGNHTATSTLNMNGSPISNAGYLFLNAQDGVNEGGELQLKGAGSWGNIQIDNLQGNARIHTLATGKRLQVLGGDGVEAVSFYGSGANITTLNAANLASGTVPAARLGTGTANATTYLRGDNTWATFAAGDAPTLDGLDSAQFLRSDADDTTTGRVTSTGGLGASQAMATATGSLGAFQAQSQGSGVTAGAAFITFHRPASYAAYFGIDTDNQFKVGGWSMGANAHKVWHAGNDGASSGLDADTVDGLTSTQLQDNLGNHTATTTLALGANALSSSAGTVIDGNGGWHRTYGNTGWYSQTHGGGWNMEDSTWLRAYGGKAVYTSNVVRADSGIRTNQVCDVNGGNCVAQSALASGGGGVPAGTLCGLGYRGGTNAMNPCSQSGSLQRSCQGVDVRSSCPAGYSQESMSLGNHSCMYTCSKD